jgi:streptomycin 6-kinase
VQAPSDSSQRHRHGPSPDPDAILRFTDWLVGATGLDRSPAEAWLTVRTVASWLWCLEAGLTEDPVRCARFVAAFSDE